MHVIDLTHLARYRSFSQEAAPNGIAEILRKFAPALFATYNLRGAGGGHVDTFNGLSVGSIKLDFGAISAARVAAGGAALASTDILQLFGVKAGTWVIAAFIQTTKVEGATATFGLGDGVDDVGYEGTHAGNGLVWSTSFVTGLYALEEAGGKLYTEDDTIDLRLSSNGVDASVLHVTVVTMELARQRQ